MHGKVILNYLKKLNGWLRVFIDSSDVAEELAWAFAPSQGITPAIKTSPAISAHFSKILNSNKALLPVLGMQAVIYLLYSLTKFSIAILDYKVTPQKKHKRLIKAALLFCSAIFLGIIAACVVFVGTKVLIALYCIQAAIDVAVTVKNLFTNITHFFASKTRVDTNKDQPKTVTQMYNQASVISKNIIKNSKKLIFPAVIITLTVLSFVPIPIVSTIAQLALASIAIGVLALNLWTQYKNYKAKQALLAKANSVEVEMTEVNVNTNKLSPDLSCKSEAAMQIKSEQLQTNCREIKARTNPDIILPLAATPIHAMPCERENIKKSQDESKLDLAPTTKAQVLHDTTDAQINQDKCAKSKEQRLLTELTWSSLRTRHIEKASSQKNIYNSRRSRVR